jgi:hypothetical protein
MKKIVLVTAEPSANYHFASFDEKHARGLVHLIPSISEPQGKSNVTTTDDMNVIDDAALVVICGGPVSEWTRHIGILANEAGVPVVFSEIAYLDSTPSTLDMPVIEAYSAVSPYGVFNISGYFNEDDMDVTVTGHPFLDNLPEWKPLPKRVLFLSSVFKKDSGTELRKAARKLEEAGYDVVIRTHPREIESWNDFKVSKEPSLIADLARSEIVVGIPGTAFIAAAAMEIPTLAIEGSSSDSTLPELRHLFSYVKANEIEYSVKHIKPLDKVARGFLTGTVGELDGKNSSDRLVDFWHKHAE